MCNDVENQFNHVMREGLSLGDFEVINKRMWQLITAMSPDPASQLIRSFERIGLGMRTQIEYFYQKVSSTNLAKNAFSSKLNSCATTRICFSSSKRLPQTAAT